MLCSAIIISYQKNFFNKKSPQRAAKICCKYGKNQKSGERIREGRKRNRRNFPSTTTEDGDLVKKLYRADREDPILFFASGYSEGIPLTVDNLVLVCNELQLGRKDLEERTPMLIRERAGQWKEKKKEKQEKNPENVQKVVDTGFYL